MGTPRGALQGVAVGDGRTHRATYVPHHPRLQEAVLWGGEEEWMLAGVASCGLCPVSRWMCASQSLVLAVLLAVVLAVALGLVLAVAPVCGCMYVS